MSRRRRLSAPVVFFALPALAAWAAVVAVLSIPTDPKNSVLFGYSFSRLATAGLLFLAGLALAGAATQLWRSPQWRAWLDERVLQNRRLVTGLIWLSGALLLAGWVFNFLPLYRFGLLQATVERLKPAAIWLTFFAGESFLALQAQRYGLHTQTLRAALRSERRALWLAGGLLLAFLLLWGFIAATGLGIQPGGEDMWYETGAPVLGLQALVAWLAGMGLLAVEVEFSRQNGGKLSILTGKFDFVVFVVIWALAAGLWALTPLRDSHFSPGPYPPNNAFAPYSDGSYFDSMAQFALIGQGIHNGSFFDRGLYPALLTFLHVIGGQNYATIAALQAALLAVLPALVYLLGKRLHSRAAGMMAAVLVALRGANAIAAATWINGANPKLLLTDFACGVLVALFTLLLVRWLADGLRPSGAVLAGGALGLAIMVRTNPLLLAPVALLLAASASILSRPRAWKRWLLVSALFCAAIFAAALPWSVRNDLVFPKAGLLNVFTRRIQAVQNTRYQSTPAQAAVDPHATPAPAAIKPAKPKSSGLVSLASLQRAAGFVPEHFLHNLVTSTLVLPVTLQFDDLKHTVNSAQPFWLEDWNGALPPNAIPLLGLNLALMAVGAAFAWRKAGWAGIAPAAVFLGYQLANGFARTSGGRYIVPVDWVVVVYFALGVVQVSLWGLALLGFDFSQGINVSRNPWGWGFGAKSLRNLSKKKSKFFLFVLLSDFAPKPQPQGLRETLIPILLLLAVILVGGLAPLSEAFFPQRYQNLSDQQALALLESNGALEQTGYSAQELEQFLSSDQAVARMGRLLYPRYLSIDQGVPGGSNVYTYQPYPRLAFTLLGKFGNASFILPMQASPQPIPDGIDALVLGCKGSGSNALMAVLLDGSENRVLSRDPAVPLACPLPDPVCNDNRECK